MFEDLKRQMQAELHNEIEQHIEKRKQEISSLKPVDTLSISVNTQFADKLLDNPYLCRELHQEIVENYLPCGHISFKHYDEYWDQIGTLSKEDLNCRDDETLYCKAWLSTDLKSGVMAYRDGYESEYSFRTFKIIRRGKNGREFCGVHDRIEHLFRKRYDDFIAEMILLGQDASSSN